MFDFRIFFLRILAAIIDIVPLLVIMILLAGIFTDFNQAKQAFFENPQDAQRVLQLQTYLQGISVATLLVWMIYCIYAECSPRQGTIGKTALNLVVVNKSSQTISLEQALIRNISKMVFASFLYIGIFGLLWMLFNNKRQCVHDLVASTFVIPTSLSPQP